MILCVEPHQRAFEPIPRIENIELVLGSEMKDSGTLVIYMSDRCGYCIKLRNEMPSPSDRELLNIWYVLNDSSEENIKDEEKYYSDCNVYLFDKSKTKEYKYSPTAVLYDKMASTSENTRAIEKVFGIKCLRELQG